MLCVSCLVMRIFEADRDYYAAISGVERSRFDLEQG